MSRRSYFIPTVAITGSAAFLFASFLGPQHKTEHHHDKEETTYVSSYNAYTQAASGEEIVTPQIEVTYDGGYSIGCGGGGGGGGGGYYVGGGGHRSYRGHRPHRRPHIRPHRPRPHRPHVRPHHVRPDRPHHVTPTPHRPRPPHVRPSPDRPRPPHVRPSPDRPRPPHVRPTPPHVNPRPGVVTPTPTPSPKPNPDRPTIDVDDQIPEGTTISVRGENGGSRGNNGQRVSSAQRNNHRSGLTDERGRRYEWMGSSRSPDGSRRDVYRGSDGSTVTRNTSRDGRVSFESDRTDGSSPRMVRDNGNGHRSQVRTPSRRPDSRPSVQRRTPQNRPSVNRPRTPQRRPTVNRPRTPQRGPSIQRRSGGRDHRVSRPSRPPTRQMRPRPPSRPRPQVRSGSHSRPRPTIRRSTPRRQHSRPARRPSRGRR